MLSHHLAKFGVHRLCEGGDITCFICHVTTILKGLVTCGWGPLILSYHSAKCGVYRPDGTGNNGVCNISSNSSSIFNSNSNAEVRLTLYYL